MPNINLLGEVLKRIKPATLKKYLEGDEVTQKLANIKLDQIIKAYFYDMEKDGTERELALKYAQIAFGETQASNIIYRAFIKRASEYIILLREIDIPEKRLKSMKILQDRNLI